MIEKLEKNAEQRNKAIKSLTEYKESNLALSAAEYLTLPIKSSGLWCEAIRFPFE